jgi:hypothetical protein
MIVYKIKDNKIVGISRKDENYVIKENEYQTDTWYQKPFFNGTEVVESITQEEIDAQAEQEVQNVINKQKAEQHAELSKTDWYVIRQLETGVDIPENILLERQAIRDKYNN